VTARRAGLFGLALLIVAMFGDLLIAPGSQVLGIEGGDLSDQFLPWRDFGFSELAKGNLALWNPHIFSGAPYFGGMQSALLYPLNWIHLFLPLPLAVNWTIALNLWLLGALTFLWASRREMHPFAAFVSGALAIFCAPVFLQVFAGHLSALSSMAWIPLEFLAIDEWFARRRPAWCLVGMFAVAMQLLGGHPQYAYFAGIATGAYALVRLAEPQRSRLALLAGIVSISVGGALLAAVQLLAGAQAVRETVRALPLPIWFAGSVSLSPENLITLFAPDFFGDYTGHAYWGRWYLWEECAFVGIGGLALAAYGISGSGAIAKRALVATLAVTVILAFGEYSPLYRTLYEWVPLYDRFRGSAKFIFFVALILSLFAGHGFDRILREGKVAPRALVAATAVVVALALSGAVVSGTDWSAVLSAMHATRQTYLDAASYANPAFASMSRSYSALGLYLAAFVLAAGIVLAMWVRRESRAAYVLGALVIAEVFTFARLHRPTFDSSYAVIPQLRDFLASHPGDYRTLNLRTPNSAMSMGTFDAWGYDPGVTRRYAELIAWTQGEDPDIATQYMTFHRFPPLLTMLRVKDIVAFQGHTMHIYPGSAPPLGRLELVGSYQVHTQRDAILRALGAPSFDPRKEVVLEQQPDPAPVQFSMPGRARIVREGTDFMDIEADVPSPSLLLVTDAWADGWRAKPLAGSDQSSYRLMPADYALRAVALGPGHHHLRLEYAPPLFYVGAALSALAWVAWVLGLMLSLRKRTKSHA
jgi:hypothetical protein